MHPQKKLTVRVDKEAYRAFKTKTTTQDTDMSKLVRKWINQFLKGEIQ